MVFGCLVDEMGGRGFAIFGEAGLWGWLGRGAVVDGIDITGRCKYKVRVRVRVRLA